jgi:hypothetical protein
MTSWYDDARRRLEQRQQQEEQQRLQALQQQKQIYNELLKIVESVGALERLEYIRIKEWRCGQINRFHRVVDSRPEQDYYLDTIRPYFEAGLRLHFEYEVLKFVVHGGFSDDPLYRDVMYPPFEPESKYLDRTTQTVALTISATHSKSDGSRQLSFAGKLLSTPLSNFAALIEELDDAIFLYCETERSRFPLEKRAQQNQENQQEKNRYRKYKPRKKRSY